MKKLSLGIILGLLMLIPFIDKVASTAESAQDWIVGLLCMVAVLATVCWLVARADRSETVSGQAPIAVPPQAVASGNAVRSELVPARSAVAPICSGCGAASKGTKFCPECGKLFSSKSACSQ